MTTWDCFLYHNLTKEHKSATSLGHDVDFLLFERQIIKIKENYDVVSPIEAVELIKENKKGKFATIWFDDGFKSILDIGLPILNKHNIKATVSVCSSLYRHEEIFWRKKLAFVIRQNKGSKFVTYLQKNSNLRGWNLTNIMEQSLNNFSEEFIILLNNFLIKDKVIPCKSTLLNEFCTKDELNTLLDNGWQLSNHSSHHYPITETTGFHLIDKEFQLNNESIQQDFGIACSLYVAPFCREGKMDDRVKSYAMSQKDKSCYLVLVNEKTNTIKNIEQGLIYRRTARTI